MRRTLRSIHRWLTERGSHLFQHRSGVAIAFPRLCVFLTLCLFALTLCRTAWMSDDAYITYRVVDNALHGFGLRWNIGERVQVFTHPLWMLLNLVAYACTHEMYLTGMLLSAGFSMVAAGLLARRIARAPAAGVFAVSALISSRAFVDFSTSGLENPLSHVLLALFVWVWLRPDTTRRWFFHLAAIAGLAALNRMDSLLLFLPALVWAGWSLGRKAWGPLALGFLPFALWELFSLIYYGFPFPNTAYAKLGTGIPPGELLQQGFWYFAHVTTYDPTTLPLILAGFVMPLLARQYRTIPLALGIALYLVYTVKVGGDFMAGRFLTMPLFLAVAIIASARLHLSPIVWGTATTAVLCLTLTKPYAPFVTGFGFGRGPERYGWYAHGIADERRCWFKTTGLALRSAEIERSTHQQPLTGRPMPARNPTVLTAGSVGIAGFRLGPGVHIIDIYALCDPLLARLPSRFNPRWRIGHFERIVPKGYAEGLRLGLNGIEDPGLKEFYDKLDLIVRGPIWTTERWQALVAMNLGRYNHLIDQHAYRFGDVTNGGIKK